MSNVMAIDAANSQPDVICTCFVCFFKSQIWKIFVQMSLWAHEMYNQTLQGRGPELVHHFYLSKLKYITNWLMFDL